MTGAGDRMLSVPGARTSIALLFSLLLSACHAGPPKIVPPPPAAPRFAQLQRSIDTILAAPALSRGTWGIVVRSLSSNETFYALNAHKLMMPASTQKILTLAVAADQLGWSFTFPTRIFSVGSIDNGILTGDLIVVGSGDPTFDDWDGAAAARFAQWASELRSAGIIKIDGRIIGDDNAFDDDGLGAGWAWDDLGSSFATSVGALQFNQNTAQLVITPGASGDRPAVTVKPEAARLSVLNRASTSASGPALSVRPVPHTSSLELTGSIAPAAERAVRNVSVPNPTLYFAEAVRDGLMHNGIEILGSAVDVDDLPQPPDAANATLRLEMESQGLAAIATTMMKMSQNLYAETLLRTLAARASASGSTAAARAILDATLTAWGVAAGEVLEVDGSGLSRYNLATPDALATVLRHVYADDRLRDTFISTLPRAGIDGTLAERMKGTPAAGNVQAKTGSFSNARSLAGYLRTADGEPLEFVVMANNYGAAPSVIDNATDAILVELAAFSRR